MSLLPDPSAVGATAAGTTLTGDRAAGLARSFQKRLRERVVQVDADRTVPVETIAELQDLGLLRLLQPTRFGGHELTLSTLMDVTIELGQACTSSAWVYGMLASHAWLVGLFPEQAQHDVWDDDPHNLTCRSVDAPGPVLEPIAGGFRLRDGVFACASGCDYADWAIVACRSPGENRRMDRRWVLVPRSSIEIVDDWYESSLRGGGSKTLRVDDAIVPAHRSVLVAELATGDAPGSAANPGPLYRMPVASGLPVASVGSAMGAAHGALAALAERIGEWQAVPLIDDSTAAEALALLRLGHASVQLDAARQLLLHDDAALMARLVLGESLLEWERRRHTLHFAYAAKLCSAALEMLLIGQHGSWNAESGVSPRFWRDGHAALSHRSFDWDAARMRYGRSLLTPSRMSSQGSP